MSRQSLHPKHMKTLILSDIHSNIDALLAIEEKEKSWDELYVSGDIVDYGFFPREVIAWLKKHRAHVVMGNHDAHILRLLAEQPKPDMEQPFSFAQYNISLLREEEIAYLKSLPAQLEFVLDGVPCLMTHSYTNGYDLVYNQTQFQAFWEEHVTQHPTDCPKKLLLFGHTHRGAICSIGNGMTWMNPGSASYRRNDDPDKEASYIISEDGVMEVRHVPYPREHLYQMVRDLNLTPAERRHGTFFYGPYPYFQPIEAFQNVD